jgi:transposase
VSFDPYQRIAELEAAVAERDARIAKRESLLAIALARIDELEARLKRNSKNSDTPPSADRPGAPKPPPNTKASGRKRGGQPGHPGSHRGSVVPDSVVDHFPAACDHCQSALTPADTSDPLRHQVTELPPICIEVVEHRLHRLACPDCGKHSRASLPVGIPTSQFGPRITAAVALLSGRFRISRREVSALFAELFGGGLSVGSVQALCERVSVAITVPVAEVADHIEASPVVHADETGWRHQGKRHWLWMASSKSATVFKIHRKRGHEGCDSVLSRSYAGIVVSDRWSVYKRYENRALCHAHLLRNWTAVAECKNADAKRLGKWAVSETLCLLRWHRQVRDGTITLAGLQRRMRLLKGRYAKLLEQAKVSRHKRTKRLAKQLQAQWDALWTFASTPGVDPTNNHGERQIRPAVLHRKGSLGTWSDAGARFLERAMTVAATAKLQGVRLLDFLHAACTASLTQQAPPSLFAAAN